MSVDPYSSARGVSPYSDLMSVQTVKTNDLASRVSLGSHGHSLLSRVRIGFARLADACAGSLDRICGRGSFR